MTTTHSGPDFCSVYWCWDIKTGYDGHCVDNLMMSIAFSFLRNYSVFFMLSILQTKKKSHKIYLLHRGLEIGKKCNETKKITVRPSHFSNFFWHLKITYKICVNLKSRLSNGLIVPQINMLTCLDSNGIFLVFRLL